MDKIYSIKRIKLPNSKNFIHNKKLKKLYYFLTIWLVAGFTVAYIVNCLSGPFQKLCIEETNKIGTMILNDVSTKVLQNVEYEDLIMISKDANDKITMVKSNVILINILASDIAYKIQEELNALEKRDIPIAMGVLSGIKLLSARGPSINIKVKPVGNVVTNFKSSFEAARYKSNNT